ncbi:membrane protein [Kordiimonas sediminis]|uniref:Membrane protein n=1 Tax=Kordiimonas sediminis TaxID=1735581 RepID=A0A919AYG3_9PROT|nr:DUF2306 domain-containing protein [Kordiimonas sediminis]GHF30979.1 membrane protein [Kordiimonas sediminis]
MTSRTKVAAGFVSPVFARKAIENSAKFWFMTVLGGQLIFSYYIIAFYYKAVALWDIERFNKVMPAGYIEGDVGGNISVVAHVIFAAIITVGGLLQLIPMIRSKLPALHRWNGRLYILTAMIMSLSGAYMILTRYDKVAGDFFGQVTLMLNGVIIVTCAVMAFKYARVKKFAKHREWALRLFVAVSGVWMFRVGLMAWLMIHGRPVGFDPATFSGPFLTVLFTAVYVLPLFFLEIYLRAQARGTAAQKLFTATGIFALSLLMAAGIFSATMGMWLPRI